MELLTLFADKGVAIQNVKISNHHIKVCPFFNNYARPLSKVLFLQTDDMIEQLASLLLPIDALLAHEDFNPHVNAETTVVSLFRNMWFLCILFHFTVQDDKEETAMEWQKPALARIAAKTPAMVMEESHESIASDVEYNSVIRQEYADKVSILMFGEKARMLKC